MTKIKHAQLEWNDLGTPISEQFDDVYFSNNDGLAETRYVFLTQNRLPERWQTCEQSRFVIAETGFGTGLNFLAVWQWFEQFREQHPNAPLKQLHFISFEKFPVTLPDLKKAHSAWPELEKYAQELQQNYPSALPECQRVVLADGAITLDLWLGDIKDNLPNVPTYANGIVDAWFLDGFAPSKNPEMWNQDLFNGMVNLAKQDCTVATFTAAGFVRRGLMEAGFVMKKAKGFGHKREMIVGTVEEKQPYSNISPLFDVQPALGFDESDSEQRQDIAIIGGGIASASLAWSLLQRGSTVTLYCKDRATGQGASGNLQGALYPLLNGDHSAVSRLFAPSFTFARQFYDSVAKKMHFDHHWCGVTQLLWNETELVKLSKLVQGQFPEDIVIGLDAEQTHQTVGLDCSVGSVHYPLGGWLSPQQCTQGLFDYLAEHKDCTLIFDCEVKTLEQTQDKQWHLQTNQGEFTHHTLVVANGHHFDQFEQTKNIPLSKVKGQVSTIPTTDTLQKLNTVLCYDGYLTPENPNTEHHCIGASYDMNNLTTDFDPKAQTQNAEKLQACLPDQTWPQQVNVEGNHSRQGIRTVSRDHLPFVGNIGQYETIIQDYANLRNQPLETVPPVKHYHNLFSFMGLGSRGLTSAPLLGEVLASQIHQQPLPLSVKVLETIHPSRIWVRKLRKGRPLPLKNTRN